MKKLDRKGFTLVELLVTIVIMLTILALAIVSYVNISDRKKVEASNQIKAQAELAAEQYFQSNNYLLRELTDEDKEAIVSIGKLVKDDYLNKVIDPSTGEPLDECSYVSVKKDKSGYNYTFVSDPKEKENGTCDNNDFTIVKDNSPKAPEADIEFFTLKNGKEEKISIDMNNWLNINKLGENGKLKVVIKPESALPITKVTYKLIGETEKSATKSGDNYYFLVEKDSVENGVPIVVANESGKEFKTEVGWKKDTVAPKAIASSATSSWTKDANSTKYTCTVTDGTSKLQSVVQYWNKTELNETDANGTYKWSGTGYPSGGSQNEKDVSGKESYTSNEQFYADGVRKVIYKACDTAGNCSFSNEAIVRLDRTAPTCSITISGQKGNVVNNIQWYIPNNYVTLTLNKSGDSLSGVDSYGLATSLDNYNGKTSTTQGQTAKVVWYGSIRDKAGNKSSCSSTFAVETSVSFAFNTNSSNAATGATSTSSGKKIFGTNKNPSTYENTCGYNSCSSIRCTTNGSTQCPKAYFAKACMNVGAHLAYFNINAISAGGAKTVSVATTPGTTSNGVAVKKLSEQKNCPFTVKDGKYNAYSCQRTGTNKLNVTVYEYSYTSPAGRKASNPVTLYTQYMADCGY